MQCSLALNVNFPKISTITVKSMQDSFSSCYKEFSVSLEPITINGKDVSFNKDSMKLNEWYPFSYNTEDYLAVKITDTTIDIFRIKHKK